MRSLLTRSASALCLIGTLYAASPLADAQPIDPLRFSPLVGGGYWEYTLTSFSTTLTAGPPSKFVSMSIAGESDTVVIDGVTWRRVVFREYDTGMTQIGTFDCGVRIDDGGVQRLAGLPNPSGGGCRISGHPLYINVLFNPNGPVIYEEDATVQIGSLHYSVPVTARGWFAGSGTGGSGSSQGYRYAADIGLYSSSDSFTLHWQVGGGSRSQMYSLTYAEVGGETYGAAVVSAEEGTPSAPGAALLNSVFPNPVRDALRIRLHEAARAPLAWEVYDVMGRRVASGEIPAGSAEASVTLGSGASGMHVLRVIGPDGRQEARRFVRVPERGP